MCVVVVCCRGVSHAAATFERHAVCVVAIGDNGERDAPATHFFDRLTILTRFSHFAYVSEDFLDGKAVGDSSVTFETFVSRTTDRSL